MPPTGVAVGVPDDAGVESGAVSAGVGVGVLVGVCGGASGEGVGVSRGAVSLGVEVGVLVGGCDGASGVTVVVDGGRDVDMPGGSTSPGAEVGVGAGIVVAPGSGAGVAVSPKGAQAFTFATCALMIRLPVCSVMNTCVEYETPHNLQRLLNKNIWYNEHVMMRWR